MKGKLKTLLVSGALVSTICGLVGCTPSSSSATTSGQTNSSNTVSENAKDVNFVVPEGGFDTTKDVTIKFYTTMGDTLQTVFNDVLENEFAAEYPNIHVDPQFIGGYEDVRNQMNTEIASGKTDVNIAYCYPDHIATYNTARSVICLDNLIEDDTYGFSIEEYKDFVPAFYKEGSEFGDGKMYCLPFSKSTEVLYYNKVFFDEHNLKVPTHWFTKNSTDDTSMEYVCSKIKELDQDSIPLGYDSGSNLFITMCEQLDIPYTSSIGSHYLFNNSNAKEMVSKFKSWYEKGYITTKDINGAYTSNLFTSTEKTKCYMCVGSSAGASYQSIKINDGNNIKEATRIAPLPQENPQSNGAAIQQGPDVCIFQNDDPQKILASWLFVKFFTTNQRFQAEFSMQSGYMPVIRSAYNMDAYKEWLAESEENENGTINIQALSTKVSVEQEKMYFTSAAFVGSSNARTEVGNIITSALTRVKTIDQAFEDAIKKCEQ